MWQLDKLSNEKKEGPGTEHGRRKMFKGQAKVKDLIENFLRRIYWRSSWEK